MTPIARIIYYIFNKDNIPNDFFTREGIEVTHLTKE
jgi:hypothetical protein